MRIRLELSPLASQYRSGVAQYTRLLTEALSSSKDISAHGHYFDFLDRQPKPELSVTLQKNVANKIVPLKIYAKAQSFNLAPPFDLLLPKVDLTIFPNFATWPTMKSKHTATVIHDLTYLYFPELVEEKNLAHLRRVVPRSIKKADFIITVSESVKAELVKEFGLAPENCIVTPIPPDEAFFTIVSKKKISAVKEKNKINPHKKYFYFIGNFEPRKNLKNLIEAYRLLPQNIKDRYSLILAGGRGWKTEETQTALNAAIKAGEDIRHIGFINQEDSPALYQGASLFIMPSLYEGFGMPILEAMAGNCRVLANDIPVLRETGGKLATYADATNAVTFSEAMAKCLEAPSDKQLSSQAKHWSWDNNVRTIIEKTEQLS